MRKWTQKVKQVVSERIDAKLKQIMRSECNLEGKLFNLEENEEQREEYQRRNNEWFDSEIDKVYEEVLQKARFLVKLSVPLIFQEAKMKKDQAEQAA